MAHSGEGVELSRVVEETEGRKRRFVGGMAQLVRALAIAMSLFHLYTAGFGLMEAMRQRAIHLGMALGLLFLLYPATKRSDPNRLPWYDVALAALGLAAGGYLLFEMKNLVYRAGMPTTLDTVFGILTILLVLEATRRAVRPALSLVAAIFIAYALLGPYLPNLIAHRGAPVSRLVEHLYLTTEGIFGIPISVSATFVFLFILFGSFLEITGAGKLFIELAMSVFGHTRGGPAKAAVLASGLMGTVNGSSVANVVATGTFTIPLMKRVGFRPHVAGGVEVAASSSGQYMPPIMGAAAFVMAEFTGIPYARIAAAAAIPAVLDYIAILTMVHLEAVKHGIQGLPKEELPRFWPTFLRGWMLLMPVTGIVFMLLSGFTPLKAAFVGILLVLLAGFIRHGRQLGLREIAAALESGARNALGVAAACATAGIIVGVVTLTGLGLRLADVVISLAGNNLYLAMFLTMIGSMILGLGMPTTATYIILAAITAPILVKFGVPLLAAHLFVLYYGVLADDTPPVDLAGYAAAGIAKADPWRTGWQGFKFDLSAILLPFMFVTSPALLLMDVTGWELLQVIPTAILGIMSLSACIQGYLFVKANIPERIALLASAISLVSAEPISDIVGVALLMAVILVQRTRSRPKPLDPGHIQEIRIA